MTLKLSELADSQQRRIAVRDAAAGFLRREWSLAALRTCFEDGDVVNAPSLWKGMLRLEWDRIEPLTAGSGDTFGALEFCTLVEETGRALAPTPLVPCVVGRAILRATNVGPAADLAVLAHGEAVRRRDRLHTSIAAREVGGGTLLSGEKRFVSYGFQADRLIVGATAPGGAFGLFVVNAAGRGVHRVPLRLLDGSPCAEIQLHDAEATPIARDAAAARVLGEALALETVARCAELVGVAARALELAVDYAKHRVAFDQPIGSFQAIQHKLVNLRTHVEIARALYEDAARASSDERTVATAMAAFAALDDLRKVPEGALQVFGGIGTTWDHDIHLFLRRAATLSSLLGERDGFREDIVRHLGAARL